jgi:hypothetical protein
VGGAGRSDRACAEVACRLGRRIPARQRGRRDLRRDPRAVARVGTREGAGRHGAGITARADPSRRPGLVDCGSGLRSRAVAVGPHPSQRVPSPAGARIRYPCDRARRRRGDRCGHGRDLPPDH